MSQAPITIRIGSRRNFDKTDIETAYSNIVKVVGGTYFVNGVSTGPVNGSLDWRNFARGAGITNAIKSQPNSLFAVQIQDNQWNGAWTATSKTQLAPVPILSGDNSSYVVTEWNVCWESQNTAVTAIPTAATWALNVSRGGTLVQIGTTLTQANFTVCGTNSSMAAATQTGLSFQVFAGEKLVLVTTVTTPGAGNVQYHMGTVWLKAAHIK